VNWERVMVLVDMEFEIDENQFYDTSEDLCFVSDHGFDYCLASCSGVSDLHPL